MEKYKQVIVMRKDLNMRKGKMIAQGSHASLGAFLKFGTNKQFELLDPFVNEQHGIEFHIEAMQDSYLYKWFYSGQTKVTLSVDSEEELLKIYNSIPDFCPKYLVVDAGLTEFNGVSTITCFACGPINSEYIDKFTGHLKLL